MEVFNPEWGCPLGGPEGSVTIKNVTELWKKRWEISDVNIMDWEDQTIWRGVKEVIYVHCERPLLNRGGGFWHQLSATYNSDFSGDSTPTHPSTRVTLITHMAAGWERIHSSATVAIMTHTLFNAFKKRSFLLIF